MAKEALGMLGRLLLIVLVSAMSGCGRSREPMSTVSGSFRPPLPSHDQFELPDPLPAAGLVQAGSARIDPEMPNRVYVDVVVVEPSGERSGSLVEKVRHASCYGVEVIVEIRVDDAPIQLTGWREAMHRRYPNMLHFSLHACESVSPLLPDGLLRTANVVTLEYESPSGAELLSAHSVKARMVPLTRLNKEYHGKDRVLADPALVWHDEFAPIAVRPTVVSK